ncbi:hypothetical protein EYZ11_005647 [Aspergillus tanneri]|uniref:NAD-dependent epimerase/dehydratase domain-containing protein n=1 Tax=Aspergillus tanneri TaxID=1220188 RepID=A0A4S3JI04_9EURO|nr:hypothetical protein EYZ11_005647 [Aspergillus tanneri]
MSPFITVALQKGVSAYVGEGGGRWCGDHRDDAAKLYQLAVEKAKPGSIFHAVAEEGVSVKEIVTKRTADNAASSIKTRERLGWTPMAPRLIEDISVIIDFIKSRAA